ncbi:Thyrotropin-releasing hormone-degrading ectoenzyme [Aphelenchoides besseyi]|nr:Thyrotropin-releasing hormone-degrading ectoenzyme [Aphelenchoides besseyi]
MRLRLFLLLFSAVFLQVNGQLNGKKWKPHQFLGKRPRLSTSTNDDDDKERLRERLPRVVDVYHYDLQLTPYFPFPGITARQDFTFDGIVTIYFQIIEQTKSIWFYSQGLNSIDSVVLKQGNHQLTLEAYATDLDLNRVAITPIEVFKVGQNYSLTISYNAPINDYGNAGLYYVKYTNAQNKDSYLVGTFFEPQRARKMYPSFDDPHMKATFQLTLIYPSQAKIYHNVEEKVSEDLEGTEHKRTTFAVTPKMSTYLLAFVIGNFEFRNATTKRGISVRSIGIPEISAYLDESAGIAANCIDSMESLVNVNYAFKKLDNVEMIEMGHSSAMENIALIVYTRFLSQLPIATPTSLKFTQTSIICHEISHQWFGDLVTADYWGQEWLHESFAAYFQERAPQNFDSDVDFIESTMVMNKDSGLSSSRVSDHAVSTNLGQFDDVTYSSGGAMLRMFEKTVGSTSFFSSLTTYLNAHSFSNAVDSDLFEAFETTLNKPLCGSLTITNVMTDFFRQLQYPVVNVDFDSKNYVLSQVSPNADTKHWNIPIFVFNINTNSSHPTYPFFLQSDQSLCPNDPQLNSSQLLIFNHKSLTFARFRYSAAYWDRLLSSDLRNVDDQTLLGLVLDAMADEDYSLTALKDRRSIPLIQKIIKERSGKLEPHILAVLVNKYLEYEGLFVGTNDQDLYGHLLKNQLQTVYETTDPLKSGFVNYVLLQVAVRYDIGDARTIAKTLFQTLTSLCPLATTTDWENCNKIVADSRPAVYCAGVRDNDATAMQYLISYWQKLIDSSDTKFYFQYELHAVAEGLSCITDTTQINKLLDIALDKNRPEMLQALANHPTASEVILQYIQSNLNKFKPKLSLFDIALRAMISTWYRKEDLDKMNNLVLQIEHKLQLKAQKILEEALHALEKKVLVMPVVRIDFVRWIFDTQVPVGKSSWTKELTEVNADELTYTLNFGAHYPVDGYNFTADQLYTFNGVVNIVYKATKATNTITLNSHRQLITSISVQVDGTDNPVTFTRDFDNAVLTLTLQNALTVGASVNIQIIYVGLLFKTTEQKQQGVNVISQYNSVTNETSNILVTLFSNGAYPRSLVPSFDEPKYKAVWNVVVYHPSSLTALSNQKIASIQKDNKYTATTFAPTTKMSSYLLAIAIGKFQSISGVTNNGIDVRVWAAIGQEVYGQAALQAAIDAVNFMDFATGNTYNTFNNKLDVLAVPGYSGAMENWGLIIGDESYVLFNPAVHSIRQKRHVYDVVAHETVHQWFGDLVTTKSWRTTFLSEAFATYFEAVVYDKNIGFGEYFRSTASEKGLRFDEQNPTAVVIPNVITDSFNPFTPIVYEKATSVLYMLRTLIGEDNFMRALSSYITNNREGNADDSTLWNEFQNVVPASVKDWDGNALNVEQFLNPFMRQASYPILMVTKNGDKIEVRQESYYPAAALPPSDYRYEWNIPVFSGNSSSVNSVQWLKNNSVLTYSDSFNFVVNRERISYSRVLYDDSTWDPIEDAYLNGQLNETIRAQILTDNYALITRGDVSYIRVLNLLHSLSTENNELPWTYAIEILNDLLRRLKTTKEHDILTDIITSWIGSRAYIPQRSEWPLRDGNLAIIQLQSRTNRGNIVDQLQNIFKDVASRCFQSVYGTEECFGYVPDARRAILCSGLQKFPEYEPNVKSILLHLSRQSGGFVSNRAEPYVEGVACLNDNTTKQSYVQNSLSGTFADVGAALIQRIGELDQTLEVLYNAIVYDIRVAVQSKHFELAVNTLAADWSTPQRLEQFQSIQWGGLTEKQQLAVTNAVNLIKKNIDWRLKNFKDVSNWILGQ